MSRNRRNFLKRITGAGALTLLGGSEAARASAPVANSEGLGVLVDCTRCVGCRRCEKACNEVNEDLPRQPAGAFEDDSVFQRQRRMDAGAYTVVNRYHNPADPDKPTYAKFQCMHCLNPACVSACFVRALTREANGAVTYDASKCVGCRYCMAACPFQVPGYEYDNTLTPQVRKCVFCLETRLDKGEMPACVQACPMQVMTFGKRSKLLRLARARLKKHPDCYVPHIYGENEVGGTAWMYLSGMSFQEISLPKLGYHPAPGYTEPIQHALFKWFLPPMALYAALGGIMWFFNSKEKRAKAASGQGGENERG